MARKFDALSYDENAIDETLVKERLGDRLAILSFDSKQPVLTIKAEDWRDAVQIMRDDEGLKYDYFTDITCADLSRRPDYEPERRFQVVCILFSTKTRRRVRLKTFVSELEPTLDSLHPVFKGALWTEREVYEMFGITFNDHPELKRLLTPEYMEHYPLRKEYPMQGKGERDNFPRYEEIK